MTVCAFAGRRRSGKSLLSSMIQDVCSAYGMEKPEVLSFATPLKELFCELKGINMESLLLPNVKEKYRQEMQDLSELVKTNEPTYFSDRLFAKLDPSKNQIIDDLRLFDLEFLPLREKGAVIWYVYANYDNRRDRGATFDRAIDTSPYEQDLDLPAEIYLKLCGTGYIFNNKTQDDLKAEANKLVTKHFMNF